MLMCSACLIRNRQMWSVRLTLICSKSPSSGTTAWMPMYYSLQQQARIFPHYSYYLNCLHTSLLLKPNEHICKLKMFDWGHKMFTSQTVNVMFFSRYYGSPVPPPRCFWSVSESLQSDRTSPEFATENESWFHLQTSKILSFQYTIYACQSIFMQLSFI